MTAAEWPGARTARRQWARGAAGGRPAPPCASIVPPARGRPRGSSATANTQCRWSLSAFPAQTVLLGVFQREGGPPPGPCSVFAARLAPACGGTGALSPDSVLTWEARRQGWTDGSPSSARGPLHRVNTGNSCTAVPEQILVLPASQALHVAARERPRPRLPLPWRCYWRRAAANVASRKPMCRQAAPRARGAASSRARGAGPCAGLTLTRRPCVQPGPAWLAAGRPSRTSDSKRWHACTESEEGAAAPAIGACLTSGDCLLLLTDLSSWLFPPIGPGSCRRVGVGIATNRLGGGFLTLRSLALAPLNNTLAYPAPARHAIALAPA